MAHGAGTAGLETFHGISNSDFMIFWMKHGSMNLPCKCRGQK